MAHPLDTPQRGHLLPPDNDSLPGWKLYHAVAVNWLADLEAYARREIHSKGAASADTNDLLDEARETIRWSKTKLDDAQLCESDPERWLDCMILKAETNYALHKAAWRKTVARNPEWIKHRTVAKPGAMKQATGSLTDRVLNELAREENDVDAWLASDLRTEQQIIADAEFEAMILDAQHDVKAAHEFDALLAEAEFDKMLSDAEFEHWVNS